MSLVPNPAVTALPPSPTIDIFLLANELRKSRTVYDFGVGEMIPGIAAPQVFKDGVCEAISSNLIGYSNPQGAVEVREAIARDLQRNFGMTYTPDQVAVCEGPRAGLYKATMAVLPCSGPRSRAVAFAPVYESFSSIPQLLTGVASFVVPFGAGFQPDVPALKQLLQQHAADIGVIYVNSPNNPSGAMYTAETLEALADAVRPYPHIAVITDEVYRTIAYDDKPYRSIAHLLPEQTLVVGGISKEIAGTGMRLGFVAGPKHIIPVVAAAMGYTSSCNNLPVQLGYAKFLEADSDLKQRNAIRDELRAKRDVLLHQLRTLPGLKDLDVETPDGAMYVFPGVQRYYGRETPAGTVIRTDRDFSLYALNEAGVVTIPGDKMEGPGHVRFSYAVASAETLVAGCQALSDALLRLQ